jgi:hypothetical protein
MVGLTPIAILEGISTDVSKAFERIKKSQEMWRQALTTHL